MAFKRFIKRHYTSFSILAFLAMYLMYLRIGTHGTENIFEVRDGMSSKGYSGTFHLASYNPEDRHRPPYRETGSFRETVIRSDKRDVTGSVKVENNSYKKKSDNSDENGRDIVYEVDTRVQSYQGVSFPPFVVFDKPGAPGYNGVKHYLKRSHYSKQEWKQNIHDFKIYYFNEWVSRLVAVHRTLPDNRSSNGEVTKRLTSCAFLLMCKDREYPQDLPSVSVLIVFHNEAWSTLLRSIHSVIDRSPAHLLREIILLDDFSDQEHLQQALEAYIKPLDKVRLFRATRRLGLIRARNWAFQQSQGDVVVFLDSHIECYPGWLEPLVAAVLENWTTVAFPIIDLISPVSFGTAMIDYNRHVGGLEPRTLTFNWLYERTINQTGQKHYFRSPTMPGGVYAISRDWFKKLGQYDPEMTWWGGENLEMSFKVWMCGGSLLLAACSHVGHVFRSTNPMFVGVNVGSKNLVRLAEVWMDHTKHLFYEELLYRLDDTGDLSDRRRIQKSLKCRPFSWYMEEIYPELIQKIKDYGFYSGLIILEETDLCMEVFDDMTIGIANCNRSSHSQHWHLTSYGHIVSSNKEIGFFKPENGTNEIKRFQTYPVKQFPRIASPVLKIWIYDENHRLKSERLDLCIQADTGAKNVTLLPCSMSELQRWRLTTREETQMFFKAKGVKIDWND